MQLIKLKYEFNREELSKKLCSGKSPVNCPKLNGMFNYMKNWRRGGGGECGVVNGVSCAPGKNHVAGNGDTFAYCAKRI